MIHDMPATRPNLLDVVALLDAVPDADLIRGQVGTVVEIYDDENVEVEFVDDDGRTTAQETLPTRLLMVLVYNRAESA